MKNSQHSASDSLITCYQFILEKKKQNVVSFLKLNVWQKLNISQEDHDLKQFHTVEYLGCHLDSNLIGESMKTKVLKKSMQKLNFFIDKTNI